ncbi:ImmA/IrrE family metallo-endopeptidase [Ralstonia pseudosolanacearum]|uniref:ImmA/IrrE family metallo-endopeptidase n=1 Tax=Ralstonia pseudosolanacearum TaxID=1310165 RepID=UPI0009B7EE91|nr:ImmA/IrrE family metallo-endopeptidase [Ralstonia pseudosolanacearum]MDO3578252.1 ImmA/IrrE family metallo-endopeptidase [Ralstonia pseudosolanacearum]MDO3587568.1 ImmA/IrrE family metallo-endopeptidase [Ralstonia pseudosolanacearum]
MNSKKIGDEFEIRSHALVTELVKNGDLLVLPERCKIYRQKGYHSKDRGGNIIFDISIEVFVPGAKTHSLLILIECKKYKRAVRVDDIEEFFSKVQQVGAAKAKAIVISSNSFQSGAFNFASSKGIGLLRYFDDASYKWCLYRSPSTLRQTARRKDHFHDVLRGLLDESYKSKNFDVFGYANGVATNSAREFFSGLTREIKSTKLRKIRTVSAPRRLVDFMSADEIESLSQRVLHNSEQVAAPVNLEKIIAAETLASGLKLKRVPADTDASKNGTLGRIEFSPLTITIFDHPGAVPARERFTLAHELGHHFLQHGRYIRSENHELRDEPYEESSRPALRDIERMEWQANYFASCLLLPRGLLEQDLHQLAEKYKIKNRGFGFLYLDGQMCNFANYSRVTSDVMRKYGVSRGAIRLRLIALGYLNDAEHRGIAFRSRLSEALFGNWRRHAISLSR